jgi:hypothetical protein
MACEDQGRREGAHKEGRQRVSVFRTWMQVGEPIDRATYLRHGLALALVKYAGDVLIVWTASGRLWTPLDYLTAFSLLSGPPGGPRPALLWLAAWALPFIWLGVTLSFRRALDAGLSPWLAFFFFVPFANYILIALLLAAPRRTPLTLFEREPRSEGESSWPHFVVAVSAGIAVGTLLFVVLVFGLRRYTGLLFFVTPALMGAVTSFVLNRRMEASGAQSVGSIFLLVAAAGGVLLLFAGEGFVCILMAAPLAIILGLMGAVLGKLLARFRPGLSGALLPVLMVPLGGLMEPTPGTNVVSEVVSSIEIDAAPDAVWRHVIGFRPIEKPGELLFRAGIAYPMHASIDGEGVGAVRYCVFSTGAFVEPITAWVPARRLSFDVTASPPPLRELSLYEGISPPHLDGYMRSVRGEFRLVPLAGGRTRLEGSTWYTLDMEPAPYWRMWTDYIIHRIHLRVLDHIRREAEHDPTGKSAMMRGR